MTSYRDWCRLAEVLDGASTLANRVEGQLERDEITPECRVMWAHEKSLRARLHEALALLGEEQGDATAE